MGIKINSNIISQLIRRNLDRVASRLDRTFDRLSSGERISKSSHDPASLSASQQIRYEIRGLQRSQQNISGAFSMLSLAESGMESIQSMLQRARELVVQAGNDTLSPSNRAALQAELTALLEEIDRTASESTYLGSHLLDGSVVQKQIQVGSVSGQSLGVTIPNFASSVLGQIARALSASAVSTAPIAGGGDLTLNGIDIPATVADGVSSVFSASSALAKAKAINSVESKTGVHATAEKAEFVAAGSSISSVVVNGTTQQLTINGISIGPVSVSTGDADGALVSAINSKTGSTGVTASLDPGGELRLTAKDGRNIEITTTGSIADELGLAVADSDLTSEVSTGSITLTSNENFLVGGTLALIGFGGGQSAVGLDPSTALTGIDINSAQSSTESLTILDAAISQTSRSRALVGALQNRLDGLTSSLATQIEELTGSDSKIRDADFALETARLTQNQILQQAGIALLTQANIAPRTALQLLTRQ